MPGTGGGVRRGPCALRSGNGSESPVTAAEPGEDVPGTRAQCWLARLSFVLAAAAVVIVPVFAGLKSLAMLAVGLAAVAVSAASAYLFLARRGLLRWLSLAVFVLAPAGVIAAYAFFCPAVGSGRIGRHVAAGRGHRAAGPERRPRPLAHAGASRGTARRAPVPDHESEIRRR